ncbi:GNAT family N-acetyltransferase [Actinopolymorpha alba]|uniref:GNAT family N-acetyltransferase n=1 Tax=Actinopolymorpha alba TaxID=533267 RepID=UPI00036793BD|nr:GNAT family N-acetyltransferase [Actinopolymorpha alba]
MNSHVQLVRVAERHKAVLANLVQFYRYDYTEFRDLELTPHGTYPYRYLDHYFVEPGRQAFFILDGDRLAGFALMRRCEDGTNQVAEFFVLKAHRRQGAGRAAARALFRRFPGRWRLEFDHANAGAAAFWPAAAKEVASGSVEAEDLCPPEVDHPCRQLRFSVAGTHP